MAERRASARQRSLLRGCIYFNNRCSAVDCLVRDLSTGGARLILSEHVSIPDNIELYIAQKCQTLRAHVQWHQGDEAGVAFAQAGQAPSPGSNLSDELADRMHKVEAELAALRKLVKRLHKIVAPEPGEAA
jgi:hypothetical protein